MSNNVSGHTIQEKVYALKADLLSTAKNIIPNIARAPGVIRDHDIENRIKDSDIIQGYLYTDPDFRHDLARCTDRKDLRGYIYMPRPAEPVDGEPVIVTNPVNFYSFTKLDECPGWNEALFASLSTTAKFRTTLERFFIRCTCDPTYIPETDRVYAIIKPSIKDETKMTANIAIPFSVGYEANSRMFYFPVKTWENVVPGLACVNVVAQHDTYGFINGDMTKTTPITTTDILAMIPKQMISKNPKLTMDTLSIGENVQITFVYTCPFPRTTGIAPRMIIFSDQSDLGITVLNNYKNMQDYGFNQNMIATIYSCKTDIKSEGVVETILSMTFGKTIAEIRNDLIETRCKYQSKFEINRFTVVNDDIPWAFDSVLSASIKSGIIRQIALDNNVAKMVDINNIDAITSLTADEYPRLLKAMTEFNEVASEEIIRLGRRNRIRIDFQ